MKKISKRSQAEKVLKRIQSRGYEAYFVGGCVRDMVLRRRPSDFDIATNATPDEVEMMFRRTIPVGKAFGVVIVNSGQYAFEVATFRKDFDYVDGRRPSKVQYSSAKEDSLRRDFTVNGLFYDPKKRKVLDWVGGRKDAQKRLIRTIGIPKKRFNEDKLRLLRAVRFASTLGFEIERTTFKAICSMYKEICLVSSERIRDELIKIFTGPRPSLGLDLLSETKLMRKVLPEIEALKVLEYYPKSHTVKDYFCRARLMMSYVKSTNPVMAFGCLLRDIGRSQVAQKRNGQVSYVGHCKVGAKLADKILSRLRFSNELKKKIVLCIQHQDQLRDAKCMKISELKKMMQRPTFSIELEQYKIDCLANNEELSIWRFLRKKMRLFTENDLNPNPYLKGSDLIRLGLKEGPEVGRMLDELMDQQLNNSITSKKQALNFVSERIRLNK